MANAVLGANPITNMTALETAVANGGEVTFAPGEFVCQATPQKRYAALTKNTWIRSQGRTLLRLGPDNPTGPDWSSPNTPWNLFRVPAVNCEIKISPGVELWAPVNDPNKYPQSGAGPVDNTPPIAFVVEGSALPNIKRRIVWEQPFIRGNWMDGIVINGDNPMHTNPTPSGIWTELYLTDADIETCGCGISAFGNDKRVSIRGIRAKCGWVYPNGNAFGNVLYIHDGVETSVTDFDITTTYGRDAIKLEGTNSEGASKHCLIANGILRSGRPGWGQGIGVGKFTDKIISGVTFDESLWCGLQLFGKASSQNCIYRCSHAFLRTGDGLGERPIVSSVGDRFLGVKSVFDLTMENAELRFHSPVVETDMPGAVMFGLPRGNAMAQTMKVRIYEPRIRGNMRSAFDMGAGDWRITEPDVTGVYSHGSVGFGAPVGVSARIFKGSVADPRFYHGASQQDCDRVIFES